MLDGCPSRQHSRRSFAGLPSLQSNILAYDEMLDAPCAAATLHQNTHCMWDINRNHITALMHLMLLEKVRLHDEVLRTNVSSLQVQVIRGALDLTLKTGRHALTPLDEV